MAGVVVLVATAFGGAVDAADDEASTTTEVATTVAESTTTVPVTSTTVPTSADETNPCMVPGYACGWAVVEPDGSVRSVIVCTYEVCGSGSFAGMRTVLQARQMEGGNVAGWGGEGVRYDENANTFVLPGGGSIRSGDRLEDAVFPTTTLAPEEMPVVEAELVEQTEVVMTAGSVSYDVPVADGVQLEWVATFDPAGSAPPRVIDEGSIGGSVASQSVVPRDRARIIVSTRSVVGMRGVLSLTFFAGAERVASIRTTLSAVRVYRSCAQLRLDYPNGVRASRSAVSRGRGAVVNAGVFRANRALDRDGDRVICHKP